VICNVQFDSGPGLESNQVSDITSEDQYDWRIEWDCDQAWIALESG
jgi:hypothetical protein